MTMKFTTQQYADVSTAYLTESDLVLIEHQTAPHHMAEHDEGYAAFFYTPIEHDPGDQQRFIDDARAYGLSERFINIMVEAANQGIPYIRFDASGHEIEGLDPTPEFAAAV